MSKRSGLGRGIGALIPSGPARTSTEDEQAENDAAGPARTSPTRPVDVFFPEPVRKTQGTARTGQDENEGTAPAQQASRQGSVATTTAPSSERRGADAAATSEHTVSPASGDDEDGLLEVAGARLAAIEPGDIRPNASQPRTVFDEDDLSELEHSIREFGVLQPIVVRPIEGATRAPHFELIMGERRWRASQRAGLETVPAIVKETPDDAMLRDALLENLHRAQLNPLEEASAYQQLMEDFAITQEELAQRIGRSRPQISNTIRLLKLPLGVQSRVASGILSAGHARAILSVGEPAAMEKLAEKIINEDLSVRSAEAAAGLLTVRTPRTAPKQGAIQRGLEEVAERLTDRLDTRVRVSLGRTKGQIVIDFASVADLNRILTELGEEPFGDARPL